MSTYLAAGLMGISATIALEIVAFTWGVKSPNWKSWRWWVAWVAIMICAQFSLFLGVASR